MIDCRARLTSEARDLAHVQIQSLRWRETLGQPYEIDLEVVAQGRGLDAGVLEDLLTVEVEQNTEVRRIHGIARALQHLSTESRDLLCYRLTVVPRLWRLTLTRTSEIFMDMSVADIIADKLARYHLVRGTDFQLRLEESYPQREYVVQYQETDLDFVLRLAEHWGLTLFFEQTDDGEVAVFTDHGDGFGRTDTAQFVPRSRQEPGVYRLDSTTRTLPAACGVKDYNYRTPQLGLVATSAVNEGRGGVSYEYGDHFKSDDEAARFAAIRAQEVGSERTVLDGESSELGLSAGTRVRIEGHPDGEPELLITEIEHELSQAVLSHGGDGKDGYRNSFRAVPEAVRYRPRRRTAKPRIGGCISGQIESSGDGPYAELDEGGRYHVRFMFDVGEAPRAGASRLVRMAQPHAGPGYGFHFPLRHGVEVLLTFIDGDPDRPIISAAVPNPQTPSVVGSHNAPRNIIRTGGGNEINIDDTVGAERIKLSTPYGGSSFQIGAPNAPSDGAALNTSGSWNAVAKAGATTATTALTFFSDVASCLASADILDFAGATNLMGALLKKAPDLVKKAAEIAEGVMDIEAAADDTRVAAARDEALEHRNHANEQRQKKAIWMGRHPGETPPFIYDYEIGREEEQAAMADRRAELLEQQKAVNDETRQGYKEYTDWAKKGADAVKAGTDFKGKHKAALERGDSSKRDDWSQASDIVAKATGVATATATAAAAASGSGFAAVGRIPGVVIPPASPRNIQGAAAGAALVGGASALVAAPAAACVGEAQAVLAGGATALVKSPGAVEIAGMARTFITSGALVDILSAVIKSKSTGPSSYRAGTSMVVTAGAHMTLSAGATQYVRGKEVVVKSTAAMALKAGAGMKQEAGANIEAKAGGKYSLEAGGDVSLKGPKVKCAASGASLSLSGVADLKSKGNALVAADGTATVKGATVNIKGGPINLTGSTIKAKGRCLLG